jgi:hypothetical protein
MVINEFLTPSSLFFAATVLARIASKENGNAVQKRLQVQAAALFFFYKNSISIFLYIKKGTYLLSKVADIPFHGVVLFFGYTYQMLYDNNPRK